MGPGEILRWWYEEPTPDVGEVLDLSWPALLEKFDAIESDFHHFYHCDFESGVLHERSWRWFRVRVVRLLSEDSALARSMGLHKPKKVV